MGWPLSHAVPGRRRSLPHSFWPIWNGGARTTILCVLTTPCAWRACSHESEVADCSRNAIGNGRKLRQREERTDDGHPFPAVKEEPTPVVSHSRGTWQPQWGLRSS